MKQLLSYLAVATSIFYYGCKSTQPATEVSKPSFSKEGYQSDRNRALVEKMGVPSSTVQFKLISEKPSSSLEVEKWIKDNGLHLPCLALDDDPTFAPMRKTKMPDWVVKHHRNADINKKPAFLSHVIEQDDVVLLIYGDAPNEMHVISDTWAIIVRDKKTQHIKHTFDFSNFVMAPEFVHRDKNYVQQSTLWAQLEDGILYVSHAHWTYAESSKGMNAFITAIDAAKGDILWRSKPLISNGVNFVLSGNYIVSGYAFTQENSMMYALHKANGVVAGQLELQPKSTSKKFIEYIIPKGNQFYLHAHDKQYIVQMN